MEYQRLIYLYERFSNRTASLAEIQEFNELLSADEGEKVLKSMMEQTWEETAGPDSRLASGVLDMAFYTIVAQPQEKLTVPLKKGKLWPRIAAVASLLLVLSAGLYFYINTVHYRAPEYDRRAGKNQATLTLANGHKIVLTDQQRGAVAEESGIRIVKTKSGELIYEVLPQSATATNTYNTLTTGNGETYHVRLPDGSVIWLNAASAIRYPVSFNNRRERRVELTGEGYFEVAHLEKIPFKVKTGQQEVEVLGTHFNINAYTDETAIKTTLLEGAVRISTSAKDELTLKPGEQAIFTAGSLSKKQVEANTFIAWKDGKFAFEQEPLSSILKKASRWYGTDLVYSPDAGAVRLTGSISRFESLFKFLDMLERTKEVKFKTEGKQIIALKINP